MLTQGKDNGFPQFPPAVGDLEARRMRQKTISPGRRISQTGKYNVFLNHHFTPHNMDKQVNADEFVDRFMSGSLEHLKQIHSPVKVFRLSEIAPHQDIPIPPIFFGYNLLVHLTKGYFKHQIGPDSYTVQAPSVLISNYGSISAINSVDKLAQGHCILINDNAMTSLFREQEILNIFSVTPLLNLSKKESWDLDHLLQQLFDEIRGENPYRELSDSLLKSILLKIIKLSDANKRLTRRQEIALRFKQLVHKNFQNEKRLDFYADRLAVSVNYLNRCVSSVFKKSSKEIILEVLVMHAQLLLAESTKSIADIAYELDFADPSYFSRIFKKMVGMPPSNYRESAG